MIHLITGASGSGKSAYAEAQACSSGAEKLFYIAAMKPIGREAEERIAKHRAGRAGKGFVTIERERDLGALVLARPPAAGFRPAKTAVLLECLSNLTANEQFDAGGTDEEILSRILAGVQNLERQADTLIIVTNEVFSDGVRYEQETKRYLHILGEANRCLARAADLVTEVVFGIPVALKQEKSREKIL